MVTEHEMLVDEALLRIWRIELQHVELAVQNTPQGSSTTLVGQNVDFINTQVLPRCSDALQNELRKEFSIALRTTMEAVGDV